MRAKISNAQLYGILDLGYVEFDAAADVAHAMVQGGVDILQLRGKGRSIEQLALVAAQLHEVTSPAGIPLIVNDYATVALSADAEGVHLGQDDAMIASVRDMMRNGTIGKSTHSVAQAIAAGSEGANYIGFGPIFATPTKPDYPPIGLTDIAKLHEAVTIPIFCIGGIKLENLEEVIAAGAKRVAIVSGILQATDIADYTRRAKAMLPPIR